MSLDLFKSAWDAVLDGLLLTITITLASFILGQLVALPLALGLISPRRWLRYAISAYTFSVRGSPLLVQIFIVYYGLAQLEVVRSSFLWPVLRSPICCAILTIGLNGAAYCAELIAGAIRNVPSGQWEAGKALGLSKSSLLWKIVLPQTYRSILPSLSNELILTMKASTLGCVITVMEITGATRALVAQTYAPFEPFAVAGVAYLLLGALFGRVFRIVENRAAIPGR